MYNYSIDKIADMCYTVKTERKAFTDRKEYTGNQPTSKRRGLLSGFEMKGTNMSNLRLCPYIALQYTDIGAFLF